MDPIILISLIASLATLAFAVWLILGILKLPTGDKEMQDIARAISEGAQAYLARQYKTVSLVALVLTLILWLAMGSAHGLGFLLGAAASALAGYIGMNVAVRANVRTAESAKRGLGEALGVAFRGGAVTGLMVAGLALLALTLVWTATSFFDTSPLGPLVALGFGGSLISVFARLGGGIYTKGADVGTDMVGKIEKGIPEDDPRNPGVIADLVGDNVGDDAGMAADLFETYVVTAVSAIILGSLLFPQKEATILFPLLVGSVALIASALGTFFVRLPNPSTLPRQARDRSGQAQIMPALYQGLGATAIFSVLGLLGILFFLPPTLPGISQSTLFFLFLIGIATTLGMVAITEYFTSKDGAGVSRIAEASLSGHGTNIIAGLALSMRATFAPVLLIAAAIFLSYNLAGLYGVAMSVVSMLSLTGIIVAIDAFGPITDNAGGIAQMSGQKPAVRKITDALDTVGNTTKAVTKAYAIASAALAALVLFAAYTQELSRASESASRNSLFSLSDPMVLIGLLLGASLPYLFAGLAIDAVGKAAAAIVGEIRRQFREIKGIMKGTARPQYGRCVDIVTQAALREMLVPALLPVVVPLIVGLLLGSRALGGLLMGIIVTGLFVAISMTTGGAAWDNAKKYIEDGNFGGKGSPAHRAAVTGDTVGDPYKDTAGPAINPMIKVANVVALLLAPFLA